MQQVAVITDYENVMIKKKTSKNYQVIKYNDEDTDGPVNAQILLKYVFEEIFEWTPQMVRDYLNEDIIKWMNLENAISKIPFPPELSRKQDFFYIASYLYPKTIPYRKKDAVLRIYVRERTSKHPKFPLSFFKNSEGKDNFDICLKYILAENFFASSNKDIYQFFSNNKRTRAFFNENLLLKPCEKFYDTPQEAVHSVLPEVDKNELMFRYNTVKAIVEGQMKEISLTLYPETFKEKNDYLNNLLKEKKIKLKIKEIML